MLMRAVAKNHIPIVCLSAILFIAANPASAEVIWRGDFETGTTEQWRGAPKSDSVKVVEEPVREGKYAVRIDGTNAARRGNNDRIEFQYQPDPPGTAEGTERYFGWSVFLPKKLSDDVHALGYFETRNSWRQLMSFEVRGEDILYSTRVPYALRWTATGVMTPGRWHDFAVHVLWSRDPAKGFVEVWFDGSIVVPRAYTATLLDENPAFFQIGMFRATSELPESIVIDHVIEATTLAEVTPPRRAETRKTARGDTVIEKYLTHTAAKFNDRTLDGAKARDEWESRRPRLRQEFLDMLGLWPLPEKTPLKPTVTGTIERDAIVIEKLHFQSRPGLYVTGNLYRPKKSTEKMPAVVLFMGHYNRGRNGHKAFMQDHGMWFASNGYVCLILDTLERGELPARAHHGLYRGDHWWLSAGFTMAGLECWNGIRAIDYLVSRPDVDAGRITATGLSGGGTLTFFVSAVDERVTCAVPASGMTDLESNVTNGLMAIHCDCQIPFNIYGWEFTTIAALVAPRPMLFVNSHDDVGFPMASNRRIMLRLRPLYKMYDKPDLLDEFVSQGPAGGHEYRPDSRVAIFRWIQQHNGRDPQTVRDADFERIPEEQLRVFPEDKDFPRDAINYKADEAFVRPPELKLPDGDGYANWKQDLVKKLRERTFRRFPERIPVSDRVPSPGVFKFVDLPLTDRPQTRTTEIGVETTVRLYDLDTQGAPRDKAVTIVVVNEDEDVSEIPDWAKAFVGDDAVALLAPRGSGPNRITRDSPPNFVPRALAILGQTLDDGRVWDIAATAHWLERPAGVRAVGRGQAGVLAAYAGLFEPSIGSFVVIEPPNSHRKGPYLMNVLRTLDAPDALGLLAPTPLTLVRAQGPAFERTGEIYRRAGASQQFKRQ